MSSSTDLRPLILRAHRDLMEEITLHLLRRGAGRGGLPLLSCCSAGLLQWYPRGDLQRGSLRARPCSLCGGRREEGEFSHIVAGPRNRLVSQVALLLCDGCLELFPRAGGGR